MTAAKLDHSTRPNLLAIAEAAVYLHLSKATVYQLVRSRKIDSYRMGVGGRAIRIERAALDAYLAATFVPADADSQTPADPRRRQILNPDALSTLAEYGYSRNSPGRRANCQHVGAGGLSALEEFGYRHDDPPRRARKSAKK